MKRMTSPASWFGIRTKSNSKRSVSPISSLAPLRSSVRGSRSQVQEGENAAHRGAYLAPSLFPKDQDPPARPCREQLARTYLAWVNAHLKKRNASEKMVDITTGFQDGVTLLSLVEAVSGKEVRGVERHPQTPQDREETVGGVLAFLFSEGVELKSVSAGAIMEGNLKVVLRVIYSLACHYKSPAAASPQQPVECAPHASHALQEYASLKQQVSDFEKKVRDNALIAKYRRLSINSNILSDIEASEGGDETDETACDSDENSDLLDVGVPGEEPTYVNLSICNTSHQANRISSRAPDEPSPILTSSPIPSKQPSPTLAGVKNREVHAYSDNTTDLHPLLYPNYVQGLDTPNIPPTSKQNSTGGTVSVGRDDACYASLSLSLKELGPIKQQIQAVQSALSSNRDVTGATGDSANYLTSQLAELQQKYEDRCCQLSSSEQEVRQLSSDLSSVVQECTDLSNRLTESLSIRADVLRKDYLLHNSESENLSLRLAAREKEEVIKHLRGKVSLRQELVATLEDQVTELKRERGRSAKGAGPTLSSLSDSAEAPAHLSAKVKEVCDNLSSLRGRVVEDSVSSRLLDGVEEGLYTIVERLYYYTARSLKKSGGRGTNSPRPSSRSRSFDSQKSRDTLNRSNSSLKENCSDLDPNELVVFDICQTPENTLPRPNTRVLYFLNQTDTPSRVNISKSPSAVTLADIKSENNRPGKFAYHFKVYDPDFGSVKEEISQNSDIVPLYKKNTIVVHLESNEP